MDSDSKRILEAVYKMRDFFAKNFKENPEKLLPNNTLLELVQKRHTLTQVEQVVPYMLKSSLPDKLQHQAKYFLATIQEDQVILDRMKNLPCHKCARQGHPAKFCGSGTAPGHTRRAYLFDPMGKMHSNFKSRVRQWEKHGSVGQHPQPAPPLKVFYTQNKDKKNSKGEFIYRDYYEKYCR